MQYSVFQPSFRSEKVTNLHITIIFYLYVLDIYVQKTPITITGVLNRCHLYDNYHKKSRMQGKKLMEIKGLVIKWQRPLVPPFREAPVLEADPLQLVATVFTGKRTI